MTSEQLFRVFDDNSVSSFTPGHGFIAGDASHPFDPNHRKGAKVVVERHANWYNRIPTPFVSVVDTFEKAGDLAQSMSADTGSEIQVAIIDHARLRNDYGIDVYRFTELIKITKAKVDPATRSNHAHFVCVHCIPSGAVMEVCTLDEFQRYSTYNCEQNTLFGRLITSFCGGTVEQELDGDKDDDGDEPELDEGGDDGDPDEDEDEDADEPELDEDEDDGSPDEDENENEDEQELDDEDEDGSEDEPGLRLDEDEGDDDKDGEGDEDEDDPDQDEYDDKDDVDDGDEQELGYDSNGLDYYYTDRESVTTPTFQTHLFRQCQICLFHGKGVLLTAAACISSIITREPQLLMILARLGICKALC
jgi:hypothetical protein